MKPPPLRPRFEVVAPCPPVHVLRSLRRHLDRPAAPFTGAFFGGHVVLRVPPASQHFWSPQLDLEVEAHEAGARLRGLFGPRPAVWTMFVAGYAIATFGGLFGTVFGAVQWSLGTAAPWLWAAPAAALLAVGLYALARAGQRLGRAQMEGLRAFLDDALGETDPEGPPAPVGARSPVS